MRHSTTIWGFLLQPILWVLIAAQGTAANPAENDTKAHHHLTVTLYPQRSALIATDQIRIFGTMPKQIDLQLASHTRISSVRFNGKSLSYTFAKGRLTIHFIEGQSPQTQSIEVDYFCSFDDLAPINPLNTDNPGYGVSGTIGPSGTVLLSGSGWYPKMTGVQESYDLFINGPEGTVAVTSGRLVTIERQHHQTTSHWKIDSPVEGLSLSAGPYVVDRKEEDGLVAMTFFYETSRHLAPRYLEASLRYLKRYSELFGPYPFDSFAVVENFFPTGYGFPGYTLLGSRVLQLPFIPETSLPHEIVHNWWGNGVLVDFNSGNWCEGLASYTADYLNQEKRSEVAARDYRRQAMRNFSTLVPPESDFPLSRFHSRSNPTTKAVGYDKSAMVFHMLRQTVGDTAFWNALRDLYQQFLFKQASWEDLLQVFDQHAQQPLDHFLRQWILRPGAPGLKLTDVRVISDQQGYRTIGRIIQRPPIYDLNLQLALETEGSRRLKTIHLQGQETKFSLNSTRRPTMIIGDPGYHLFRQLYPEEMPPTVNSLKGSSAVIVIIADHMPHQSRSIARRFMKALGLTFIRWKKASAFTPSDADGSDILFFGFNDSTISSRLFPQELRVEKDRFHLKDQTFDGSGDVLFIITRPFGDSANSVSLLHPLSLDKLDATLRKIPHYGRYSYLVFSEGVNRMKGTWEVKKSPMKIDFR